MEADAVGSAIHESASVDSVKIPEDISRALEEMPNSNMYLCPFEPWQDEVLRKYWNMKPKEKVAELIKMPLKRCRQRIKEIGL